MYFANKHHCLRNKLELDEGVITQALIIRQYNRMKCCLHMKSILDSTNTMACAFKQYALYINMTAATFIDTLNSVIAESTISRGKCWEAGAHYPKLDRTNQGGLNVFNRENEDY